MNNTIPYSENPTQEKSEQETQTINEEKVKEYSYLPLSPVEDADPEGYYCKALEWALDNREAKDIKNIALTGPYGSGKSSILKTFIKKNTNKDLLFLNISLATFRDLNHSKANNISKEPENKNPQIDRIVHEETKEVELLRQVEYSILQQIFYHEKPEDIPHTRFRKQRSLSDENLNTWTWGLFLFIIALLFEIFHKQFWETIRFKPVVCVEIFFHVCMLGMLMYLGFRFIRKSINPLHTIKLRKFNLQNAEFAVDENLEKSILNENLDEILYFFEVTKYNVVIIEDLDRFNKTEIFTKLRELNQFINYNKTIQRKVTFIYAVRDDMFQDKERTKFFDFIIPVIPVINPSNSNEILRKIVKESSYPISSDLLDNIAFFVDDMRLLYNIMNEYYLYQKAITGKEQDKLLALVLYKNTYPNDFVALNNLKGDLYRAIHNREKYIQFHVKNMDEEVSSLSEQIRHSEKTTIRDIKELRKLYILEYFQRNRKISKFKFEDRIFENNEILENEVFDHFIRNEMSYVPLADDNLTFVLTEKFQDIEKFVDPDITYNNRLMLTENANRENIEKLKNRVTELEDRKDSIRHYTLSNLMYDDLITLDFEDETQQQMVSILLRGGYIDEHYLDYISIFYPESISREDNEFLKLLKSHSPIPFDYPLKNVTELVQKIPTIEFERDFILNYNLLDHLLSTPSSTFTRDKILKTISNGSLQSLKFIDGYIKHSAHQDKFVKHLIKRWPDIWDFLTLTSQYPQSRIHEYFQLIIEYADVTDIQKMVKKSEFGNYIANLTDLENLLHIENQLKKVIETLNIKFIDLPLKNTPLKFANFIVKGNYFELNPVMLRQIIKGNIDKDDASFITKNYTYIKKNGSKALVKYIDENINDYLEKTWIPMLESVFEEEKFLLSLLNNPDVKDEFKPVIIHKTKTRVSLLTSVLDSKLQEELFIADRIAPTWNNVYQYFLENEEILNQTLIDFLSDLDNATQLGKNRMVDNLTVENTTNLKLVKAIFLGPDIENEAYDILLDGIPYKYNEQVTLDHLEWSKVESLINKGKITLTPEHFEYLKDNFADLQIKLIEYDPMSFIHDILKYKYNTTDANLLLNSVKLNKPQKSIVIGVLNSTEVTNDKDLLKTLATMIANSSSFPVTKEIALKIVTTEPLMALRIQVMNKNFAHFSREEVREIVQAWPYPYSDLVSKRRKPLIDDEPYYRVFLNKLVELQFVSSIKDDKGKIRVNTYGKENL